jgi:hypothetical protein
MIGQGKAWTYDVALSLWILLPCHAIVVSFPHPSLNIESARRTEMASCTLVALMLAESSIVTAIPTDVNWTVSLCKREHDGGFRSYTPARELSDAMSALLYSLDNIIALGPKPDQQL